MVSEKLNLENADSGKTRTFILKKIKDNLQTQTPIVLDERGMVIIEDAELLELISGAAGAPAPGGGASGPSSNAACGNNVMCGGSNAVCPGGGGNALCRPMPR